jgi:hypothetical protein
MSREETHAQLKIWVNKEKYKKFKEIASPDISKLINKWIDEHIEINEQRRKFGINEVSKPCK